MASIFTRIVNGDLPAFKIAETEHFLAFLDINPVSKGHTLVIPKMEIEYLFDIEDEHYSSLLIFAKKVAKAIKAVVDCEKIAVAVVGLEVPHAHIHLIPVKKVGDLSFSNPRIKMSNDELEKLTSEIKSAFQE